LATGTELSADGSSKVTASDYRQLIGRIQELVRYTVPAAATTVVVSRGDEDLVDLDGRPAWHFPRLPDGRYAGQYPADSAEAISQLEDVVSDGAGYLVLPSTAFWWLEFYDDFGRHLEEHCEAVVSNADCRIYRLLEEGSYAADRARIRVLHVPGMTRADGRSLSNFLDSFLPLGAHSAVLTAGNAPLPSGAEAWQPPEEAVDEAGAAERELGALAARNVEFLVIPKSVFDWIGAHPVLGEALNRSHRLATRQHHICEIYELNSAPELPPPAPAPSTPTGVVPSEQPRRRSLLERLGLAGQPDGR
jgi:hypothetical protein